SLLNYRHGLDARAAMQRHRMLQAGVEVLYGEERTNYPLALSVDDLGSELWLTAQMKAPYDAARICGYMHRALEGVVRALEVGPERLTVGLDILAEDERRKVVVEWNATAAAYPTETRVHELFEAQAARTPDAPAVVCGSD